MCTIAVDEMKLYVFEACMISTTHGEEPHLPCSSCTHDRSNFQCRKLFLLRENGSSKKKLTCEPLFLPIKTFVFCTHSANISLQIIRGASENFKSGTFTFCLYNAYMHTVIYYKNVNKNLYL